MEQFDHAKKKRVGMPIVFATLRAPYLVCSDLVVVGLEKNETKESQIMYACRHDVCRVTQHNNSYKRVRHFF